MKNEKSMWNWNFSFKSSSFKSQLLYLVGGGRHCVSISPSDEADLQQFMFPYIASTKSECSIKTQNVQQNKTVIPWFKVQCFKYFQRECFGVLMFHLPHDISACWENCCQNLVTKVVSIRLCSYLDVTLWILLIFTIPYRWPLKIKEYSFREIIRVSSIVYLNGLSIA